MAEHGREWRDDTHDYEEQQLHDDPRHGGAATAAHAGSYYGAPPPYSAHHGGAYAAQSMHRSNQPHASTTRSIRERVEGPFPPEPRQKLSHWIKNQGEKYLNKVTFYSQVAWSVAVDPAPGSLILKVRDRAGSSGYSEPTLQHIPRSMLRPLSQGIEWLKDFTRTYREDDDSSKLSQFLKDLFAPIIRPLALVLNLIELAVAIAIGLVVGVPTLAVLVVLGVATLALNLVTNLAKVGWGLLQIISSPLTGLLSNSYEMKDQASNGWENIKAGGRGLGDLLLAAVFTILYGFATALTSLLIPLAMVAGVVVSAVGIAASPLTTVQSLVRGGMTCCDSDGGARPLHGASSHSYKSDHHMAALHSTGDRDAQIEEVEDRRNDGCCFGLFDGGSKKAEYTTSSPAFVPLGSEYTGASSGSSPLYS